MTEPPVNLQPRQRFNRIMRFEPVDRPPVWGVEEVTEGAIRRWIKEGVFPIGMALADVFPLDDHEIVYLDTGPLPSFVPHTVENTERWKTTIDAYGFTVRTLKEQSVTPTVYYYLAGIVRERADWEKLKQRYDPHDTRRLPRAWGPELWDHYNNSASPVSLRIDWGPGRGAKNGYTMGLEPFLETVIADPGLVKDLFDFWADFVIEAARPWLTHVHFDYVYFTEDGMGYKNSTLVSPGMYQALWIPAMRKVTDFLHAHGVSLIAHYTSGNIRPLMPTLLDIGVNLFFPLEVAAGMDAPKLRQQFGKQVRLIGNISRLALMEGPAAVEREFYAKVPLLMATGGYIPAVDDAIMPDIPYESYRRYLELVRGYRL
jgi:Uroporphyrinogen decarboxylase (URO-D)